MFSHSPASPSETAITDSRSRPSGYADIGSRRRRRASSASLEVTDRALNSVEPRRQLLELPRQTPRELGARLFHPCRTRGQLLARRHLPYAGLVLDIQFVIAAPRPYRC